MKKKVVIISLAIALVVLALVWVRHKQQAEIACIPDPLVVGTTADYPPFSFMKDGKVVGFDIDLMQEIATRLDRDIEIKDLPFETLIPQLQAGEIHIIAAGMSITEDRAKLIAFSDPYLVSDPLIALTLKGKTPLVSAEELMGEHVIVIPGYTVEPYLSKISGITITRAHSLNDAITMLSDGQAKALVTASATLKPLVEQYGTDKFSTLVLKDLNENIALGVAKERLPLLQEINAIITVMEKDGTLDMLKKKWNII